MIHEPREMVRLCGCPEVVFIDVANMCARNGVRKRIFGRNYSMKGIGKPILLYLLVLFLPVCLQQIYAMARSNPKLPSPSASRGRQPGNAGPNPTVQNSYNLLDRLPAPAIIGLSFLCSR